MIKYKRKFNESYDVHADVYNWFNNYCDDIEKSGSDLKYELEGIDETELVQQAIDELSLDDSYIDLVDADLISFIEDRLDEINNDVVDTSFNKNNSDWLDKYNNKADYSASLESYKKENNMIRRKLTLEQRINRLEKLLSSNRRSRKFESNANFENFTAEEAREFARILKNRSDIAVEQCSVAPNTDTWFVVITDEDGDYVTNFGIYKINGHIEAWKDDRSRYAQVFNSVAECASSIDYDYDDGEYFW